MYIGYKQMAGMSDRFSDLPDCVVERILSFLPTLEAVRTAAISKRFRTTWTLVRALDFKEEVYGVHGRKFCEFVSHVLRNLHNRLQLERLRLKCFVDCRNGMLRVEVASWLQFLLTEKQLKLCDLQFGNQICSSTSGIVPQCVFTCRSLVELTLSCCTIKVGHQSVQLPNLKILRLSFVSIEDKALENIVEGCPLLQEMRVDDCPDLTSLEFPTWGGAQKLSIDSNRSAYKYTINCPSLRSFSLKCRDTVKIVDISSVTDAFISMPDYLNVRFYKSLLKKIDHLKTLTADQWLPAIFAHLMNANHRYPYYWKSVNVLHIRWIKYGVPWVCCLLRNSPCLEELVLHGDVHRRPPRASYVTLNEFNDASWDCHFDFICLKKYLRKVTIRGYATTTYQFLLQLAEIILMNACVLEKFVIEKGDQEDFLTDEDKLVFIQELSAIPMVSQRAKIFLS